MTSPLHFHPPVIAHRGASAYAPENTMAAFTKAVQEGAKWVEFDVMQSSDKKLMIFHDDTLQRTSNGRGRLADHSYAYLRTLDAGQWFNPRFAGEKIPSFLQVMEFLIEAKMSANIEIKSLPGQEEEVVKEVLKEVIPFLSSTTSTLLFSSFSKDALICLRKYAPSCLIGLLLHEWQPDWQETCASLDCVSIHVNQAILSQETARQIKVMGKILLSYTVNDPLRAEELYAWGVDAVFSDKPTMSF